jgi:hypothetical protein
VEDRLIIAVLAPPRTGSSCIAGVLHHLGVSMGRSLRPSRINPKGFFEDLGLRKACMMFFRRPAFHPRGSVEQQTDALRQWAANRRGSRIIGAKFSTLCLMMPALLKAWPNIKVVTIHRDVESTVRSMQSAWPKWSAHLQRWIVQRMYREVDIALSMHPVPTLRLKFPDCINQPETLIRDLAAFCGIKPTNDQRCAAMQFIEPNLIQDNRHRIERLT